MAQTGRHLSRLCLGGNGSVRSRPAAAYTRERRLALADVAQRTRDSDPAGSETFAGFAFSAHQDLATAFEHSGQQGGVVGQLQYMTEVGLSLWPRDAPYWRVAANNLIPNKLHLSAADKLGRLPGETRAKGLRALSQLQGSAAQRNATRPIFEALVGAGGKLAGELPLEDAIPCAIAVGQSRMLTRHAFRDGPLMQFVEKVVARAGGPRKEPLPMSDLGALRNVASRRGFDTSSLDRAIRAGLVAEGKVFQPEDVPHIATCSSALSDKQVLNSDKFKAAMLNGQLSNSAVAQVLRVAAPRFGPMAAEEDLVVTMASQIIIAGPGDLSVRELPDLFEGIQALQDSGSDLAATHAGGLLRKVWPLLPDALPFLPPATMAAILKCSTWQFQFSAQQFSITGVFQDHPAVEAYPTRIDGGYRSLRAARVKATADFKKEVMWPTLRRLREFPLRHVGGCLSALSEGSHEIELLTAEDRKEIRQIIDVLFPPTEPESGTNSDFDKFSTEFWKGEVTTLDAVELLELACSLSEFRASADNVLSSVLDAAGERLKDNQNNSPYELTHPLLLRLCRSLDIWQGHAVEDILRHLLSSPTALRPLPTSYFAAVLSALSAHRVPKEIPLTLASEFLDRVDAGECTATPEQWVTIHSSVRALDDPPWWDRATPRILQHLIPHIADLGPTDLSRFLDACASKSVQEGRGEAQRRGGILAPTDSVNEHLQDVVAKAVSRTVLGGHWDVEQVAANWDRLGKVGWYNEPTAGAVFAHFSQALLLEPHVAILVPLVRGCANLRAHHAPLLKKIVQYYCWSLKYLRPKPLPTDQIDELLEFSSHLSTLSFESVELPKTLEEQLRNENATPRQTLAVLSALARFSHFPPDFQEACERVCSKTSGADLAALSGPELVDAFHVHLCPTFDGPAALKHWLNNDQAVKDFFLLHTSQQWYNAQEKERTVFLQSQAYADLKEAIAAEELDLRLGDPGDVYHVEFISANAKERLATMSKDPPTALVCIKAREQLRWYVPIMADAGLEADANEIVELNRSSEFRYMCRGAVQKIRHLKAMGYRPVVVWLSEWAGLETVEARREYLRGAFGALGPQNAAFSPTVPEDEQLYP